MPTTVSGSQITFNDSTVQTTAARFGGTTTTSANDITLTSASNSAQQVAMTATGKAVILPSATTLPAGPVIFSISNVGAYAFDIRDANGVNVVASVSYGSSYTLTLIDNSTTGGKWNVSAAGTSNIVTFGPLTQTATTVYNNTGCFIDCCTLSSTQALIFYATGANAMSVVLATISGATVTLGTPVTVYSATYVGSSGAVGFRAVSLSSTSAVVFVPNNSSSGTIFGFAISVSGSTVTVGTATTSGLTCNSIMQALKNDSTTGVLVVQNSANTSAIAWSVSGTTLTFGTAASNMISVTAGGTFGCCTAQSAANTFIVLSCSDAGSGNLKHRAFSISGTTITLGTTTTTDATNISYAEIGWNYKGYGVSTGTGNATYLGPNSAYILTYSGTTFVSSSAVGVTISGNATNNLVWYRTAQLGATGAYQFTAIPNGGFGGTFYRTQIWGIASTSYVSGIQGYPLTGYTGSGWTGLCSLDNSTVLFVSAQVVSGSQYLFTQIVKYNG